MVLTPFPVDGGIPEEVVVAWAVLFHHRNKAGILSGVRVEHLQSWLHAATKEKLLDPTHWEKVVRLIQDAFYKCDLTEECTWKTLILIPKGNGESRGIYLVEFLWKTVMGILNCCLMVAIQFHDTLHGLCTDRGTRTTYLESKLIQHLMAMMEEVLYYIFSYIHKGYDNTDCGRCLDILAA